MGQFYLVPTMYAFKRNLTRPYCDVDREAVPYRPEEPRKLTELSLIAAASYLTKDDVKTYQNLPQIMKNELFDMCPERHLDDQELIAAMHPKQLERGASRIIRSIMIQNF